MEWEILCMDTHAMLMLMLADDDYFFDYLDTVDDVEDGDAR